jgi:hypothetical protein
LLESRQSSSSSSSSSSRGKSKHPSLPYSDTDFIKGTKITNIPNFGTSMGRWSAVIVSASSNKRELIACHKALLTFSPILKKKNSYTDR